MSPIWVATPQVVKIGNFQVYFLEARSDQKSAEGRTLHAAVFGVDRIEYLSNGGWKQLPEQMDIDAIIRENEELKEERKRAKKIQRDD